MQIDRTLTPRALLPAIEKTFALALDKARRLDERWDAARGTPVFTIDGRYTSRGWTEWTQGFQYGVLLLAGEGVGDAGAMRIARDRVLSRMTSHLTHVGVHDHGFNTLSTYGTLARLLAEGRDLGHRERDLALCVQAVRVSGAVQAARWTPLQAGLGFIHSFNGPHSLFIDTLRSLRVLVAADRLGHVLMGEQDEAIGLLRRAIVHALTTDRFLVFHGESSQTYDVRGRTAHEGLFNCSNGVFRARSTQQGYSPFSTWTRGLAWAMLGFSELTEALAPLPASQHPTLNAETAAALGEPGGGTMGRSEILARFKRAAIATCEHYIEDVTASDGIPYWDDGAPQLHALGDWRARPAEPNNPCEPVDASAAAIAAQGLLRLGAVLGARRGVRYRQAGLTVARTLMQAPYLSEKSTHQGLLLHSLYHRPNGWDGVPPGALVPCGESSLWGDYHLLELALLIQRLAAGGPYPTFLVPGSVASASGE